MKVKYANRSSMNTKEKIRTACAELLGEKKQLSRVSVTLIAQRCDIDRSTFYAYYDDIYSIVQEFEEDAISAFFDGLPTNGAFDSKAYFHHVFRYLRENEERYRLLLSCEEPMRFMEMLRRRAVTFLTEAYDAKDRADQSAAIQFFSYGIVHMCIEYFRGELQYSLDELEYYCLHWLGELMR